MPGLVLPKFETYNAQVVYKTSQTIDESAENDEYDSTPYARSSEFHLGNLWQGTTKQPALIRS
jgi:hypothetical protein